MAEGRTGRSETFDNDLLTESNEFKIADIEVLFYFILRYLDYLAEIR